MEEDLGVFLEPALVLLVRIEIVEDDVKRTIREGGNQAVHKAEELDAAAALGMRCDDPAGSDVERGKQGRGTVPPVVVALAGQGAPVRQLQIALRPLQGLDRRLFVDTEDNRLGRGECQIFCVRGLCEGGSLVWFGISRISPSNAW